MERTEMVNERCPVVSINVTVNGSGTTVNDTVDAVREQFERQSTSEFPISTGQTTLRKAFSLMSREDDERLFCEVMVLLAKKLSPKGRTALYLAAESMAEANRAACRAVGM